MAKKNKQQIKFEADITGLKKGIKEGEESIRSLTKELKLNQEQLKGSKDNTDLLTTKLKTLQEQYDKQTKVVEQSNEAYQKAVEMLGENSEEARKWKDRIVEAETKQQKIKNAIDETNKELKIQTDRLITNGKKWEETGEHITKLGDKINSLGNKLSIVSAGTATIATVALKASIDYESAFAGVEKTVDATDEQLAKLKTGILDMSTRMPAAATEIAGVAEAAGQLGIQTDNILGFSEAMIGLGESTNLTSTEAATQLARFANIMQMSQEDFDRLGSSIVDLGNNFATTEADIVNMAMRLAGAGKQVGLSEGQVLGLSAALSSVGVEAEMGGSAISKAMVKMQNAVEMGGEKLNTILDKTGMSLRDLELLSANDSKHFKKLADSIGMTSTELNQFVTAGANLEDFAKVAGMSAEEFKKAWKEDAAGALTSFIKGLGDAESKGESAITMLTEMGLTEVRLRDSLLRAANAGDLFNSAIETGTKAWKENTALSNEVNKRYKTTESQLKMLKNEATKTAIEFGNELAPSLRQVLKDVKPLLKNISDAVKKFSQLDDKTKQNVIRLGALVVALGPTTKAVGGLTSALGTGIKGVGNFAQAIGNLKNGTNEGSEGVKTLTSLIGKVATPTGIATIAVTSLTAAFAAYIYQSHESSRAAGKVLEDTQKQVDAQNELAKSYDDSKNAVFAEMDNISKLVGELDTLVDTNGKVKEGYENRVDFILNQLNNALGTEYSRTGDLIEKYDELKKSIEEVIVKKKISALMDAEQGKYDEAIKKKAESYQAIIDRTKELSEAQEKLNQAEKDYEDNKYTMLPGVRTYYINQLDNARKTVENTQKALDESINSYDTYLKWIREYESDLVITEQGTTEEVNDLIMRRTTAYQKATDDVAGTIQQQISNQLYDLNITKQHLDESIRIKDESAQKECKIQKDAQEIQLKNLAQNLAAMVSETQGMTPAQVQAWKDLSEQSVDVYAYGLSGLPDETIKKIQDATGRVVSDEQLAAAFQRLGKEGIDGFQKNNFEQTGQEVAQSIANGMNSKLGLFSSLSQRISERLKIVASVSATSANSGHADGLAYVPHNNYIARLHEGERVLTKRENQDYTRNINNNSQNVVVNIYPQTMTEQEMIKVSNFIEREWGRRS